MSIFCSGTKKFRVAKKLDFFLLDLSELPCDIQARDNVSQQSPPLVRPVYQTDNEKRSKSNF